MFACTYWLHPATNKLQFLCEASAVDHCCKSAIGDTNNNFSMRQTKTNKSIIGVGSPQLQEPHITLAPKYWKVFFGWKHKYLIELHYSCTDQIFSILAGLKPGLLSKMESQDLKLTKCLLMSICSLPLSPLSGSWLKLLFGDQLLPSTSQYEPDLFTYARVQHIAIYDVL